jgi:hypothetical protein
MTRKRSRGKYRSKGRKRSRGRSVHGVTQQEIRDFKKAVDLHSQAAQAKIAGRQSVWKKLLRKAKAHVESMRRKGHDY